MIIRFNQLAIISITLVVTVSCVIPAIALAQSALSSTNFSMDSIDFASSSVITSNEDGVPPAISTEGPTVTDLQPTQVVITWKTDKESTSYINYGKTSKYGEETGKPDLVTTHTITVFGLQPETTYHYQVSSKDAFGQLGESQDKIFTTPAEAGINSIKISDIDYTKALVSWTTGDYTTSKIQYGKTLSYGEELESLSKSYTTNHTVQLTNLDPGQIYHLRIIATGNNDLSTQSSDFTFTTLDTPKLISTEASPVDPNTVKIIWVTNTITNGTIDYKKEGEDKSQTAGETDRLINHTTTLSHLFGNTKYTYKITVTDSQGKQAVSDNLSFTTPVDSDPPKIDSLKVNVSRSGSDLVLTANWQTNEPATSGGGIENKASNKTTSLSSDSRVALDHTLTKVGIDPATPYSFTAISSDSSGNKSQQSINFISPAVPKSIISLLVDSISVSFGWVSNIFK